MYTMEPFKTDTVRDVTSVYYKEVPFIQGYEVVKFLLIFNVSHN